MQYQALYNGNFASLGDAVTDWGQMITKLEDLAEDADGRLNGLAKKADWAGENASVSREFVAKTVKEFQDAVKEATSIRNILRDARKDLIDCRDKLKERVQTAEREHNITVTSDGDTWTVNNHIHPDRAAKSVPKADQGDVDALAADVKRILADATEADNTAATALRTLVDGTPYGFADARYDSLDDAQKALRDADAALKLAAKKADLTNTELASLNKLLKANHGDPLFAERLATKLGPDGTLDFYARVADGDQFSKYPRSPRALPKELQERRKLLSALEKDLGLTLATATRSDSPAMQKWEDTVIAHGGHRSRDTGYYNFQVMSNLMRNGRYDTSFLRRYGSELHDFETKYTADQAGRLQPRKHADDPLPWIKQFNPTNEIQRLNYGADNDAGNDPFVGYLEALGHNPDASTDYLRSSINFDYLTEERDWPEDHAELGAKKTAGYAYLGHALESASTGVAYDSPTGELHRDAATAEVAQQVVERYGQVAHGHGKDTGLSGSELMHKQDGIAGSLGRIGAAYIDDLNWGLDGSEDDRSLFAQDTSGRPDGERAHFKAESAGRFLGVLGQDPGAYADIGHAQQAYTTSMLETHPPVVDADGEVSSGEATTALRTGAHVQGIIDRARGDQVESDGATADKAYNDAIDRRSHNVRATVGAASTGLSVLIPSPDAGLGKLVVPVAGVSVDSTIQRLLFNNFQDYANSQHRDYSDDYQGQVSRIADKGINASWFPGRRVLEGLRHDGQLSDTEYIALKDAFTTAHTTGYTQGNVGQNFAGNLPVSG
ncbi:hypothetical protein [Streptomyces cucumeris]|uniref:hypothetical protein n=1 Tax=Streptomyces cucumeris TaxID=2962890 RepID=UPI003D738A88